MVVTLGNEVHRIRVKPGEDGMKEFQAEIRRLFQIPEEVEFEVSPAPVRVLPVSMVTLGAGQHVPSMCV